MPFHLQDRLRFLGIDHEVTQSLRSFWPVVHAALPGIVDEFYRFIGRWPELAAKFPSEHSMSRARAKQQEHWQLVFRADFGESYEESVRRVGQAHARIGLEPHLFVGGYAVLTRSLLGLAASQSHVTQATKTQRVQALNQIAMLDLESVISAYFEASTLRSVQDERAVSDRLLRAMLPQEIADELKSNHRVVPRHHPRVAVLFGDIVGFTSLTRRLSPDALVELLDLLFSSFDLLAERSGLERIKTIGDAYMVVAGLRDAQAADVCSITRMGLAMVAFCDEFSLHTGLEVRQRVGIHFGELIAGVVGRQRFAFDVWGDTVNLASRLESSGEPGRVHLSAAAALELWGVHNVESRGDTEVRGVGLLPTFWAEERRSAERRAIDALSAIKLVAAERRIAHLDRELQGNLGRWLNTPVANAAH